MAAAGAVRFVPTDGVRRAAPRRHCAPCARRIQRLFAIPESSREPSCPRIVHGPEGAPVRAPPRPAMPAKLSPHLRRYGRGFMRASRYRSRSLTRCPLGPGSDTRRLGYAAARIRAGSERRQLKNTVVGIRQRTSGMVNEAKHPARERIGPDASLHFDLTGSGKRVQGTVRAAAC